MGVAVDRRRAADALVERVLLLLAACGLARHEQGEEEQGQPLR